ncbi:nucleotide exchange factor GrpE [Myroides sp. LJL115]
MDSKKDIHTEQDASTNNSQEVNNQEMNNKEVNSQEENTATQEAKIAQETELTPEEQLTAKLTEEKDRYLRLFAEFENFKRRTSKERIELFKTAGQDVIQSLLPVLDDFDRAIVELEKEGDSEHLTGVKLISTKLRDTLSIKGLEEVEIKSGDVFNVDIAEAVTQIPAGDELKGKVVDVIERGYKLGDKIIRFPKVVIGQ